MANFKYKFEDRVRIWPKESKLHKGKVGVVIHRETLSDGNYYSLHGYSEKFAESALISLSQKRKGDKGKSDKSKAKEFTQRNSK